MTDVTQVDGVVIGVDVGGTKVAGFVDPDDEMQPRPNASGTAASPHSFSLRNTSCGGSEIH